MVSGTSEPSAFSDDDVARLTREANEILTWLLASPDGQDAMKFSRAQKVVKQVIDMETREAARKAFAQQQSHADIDFLGRVETLQDVLQRPEEPVRARIEDLLVVGHNTTVAAPAKTGKTVLQANRVRSYVDGVPFLGRYEVYTPVSGNVAVWNYELSDNQMHNWFRRLGIRNADKVFVANLRGRGHYLQDDLICEMAVKWLIEHEIEVWEIDPLQAALRGSVNDDAVAAEWIGNVERVKAEAGVKDLVLTVHMGHAASYKDADKATERAIGSARWMGWPDNMWTYIRNRDDGLNYLRAQGRDVDVDEFSVDWDPETYELRHRGEKSGRKDVAANRVWVSLRDALLKEQSTPKYRLDLEESAGTNGTAKATARRYVRVLKTAGLIESYNAPNPNGSGRDVLAYRVTEGGRAILGEAVSNPPEGYEWDF